MGTPGDDRWVSAAEIGDYAFCPRSHRYARTRPDAPEPDASRARRSDGLGYHADAGRGIERRSGRAGAYAALAVAGLLLLALAILGTVSG